MPKCPTSNNTTISGVWEDFRDCCGPRPGSMNTARKEELYNEDLDFYSVWALNQGIAEPLNDSNYKVFGKWFSWKLTMGTNSGANLPMRIRDHVGISCVLCPYDTHCPDLRAEHMTGGVPAVQSDHGDYYMRVESRGSKWGFACTFSDCPYFISTGRVYFYV
jgi:hypothetical protein